MSSKTRNLEISAFVLLYLIAQGVRADGIPNSGISDFFYNQATGTFVLDTDGQTTVSILIEGPQAVSIDRFAGLDPATGTNWIQGYFAGKEQWIELSLSGVQGVFKIATYNTGLDQSVFLSAEYGTLGGVIAFTQVKSLSYAADFDRDNDVDGSDLSRWTLDYSINELSDANNDGYSNGLDFLIWQRSTGGGASLVASIPEPESGLMSLAGWVVVCPLVRRRLRPEG